MDAPPRAAPHLLVPTVPRGNVFEAAPAALFLLLFAACSTPAADPDPPLYEPPGDGVPKGCVAEVFHDRPLVHTLGLSSHLPWGDGGADAAQRGYEVERWAELGVRVVRRDLYWSTIEPEKGVFDFESADRVVDATDSVDAEVLGLLVYGNSWATEGTDDTKYPPDDPADFGDYAAAVAERYRGRIQRYEVWNEPNAGVRFWKPEEDPEAYGELLIEAADRIHEVDPDALVSLGGLFHPDLAFYTPGPQFLDEVHAAHPDLGDHIDAVAFHPYRYPFTAPEAEEGAQPSMLTDICETRAQIEAMGVNRLWITEMGWHTADDALFAGVSYEDQAAYLVRGALISAAHGIEMFLWYTFRDSGTDDADQEQMFGLHEHDADVLTDPPAAPKPAATAFAVLAQELGDHDAVRDRSQELGLDATTYGYELSGGDGTVVALWTVSAETTVLLPGSGSAELVQMDGETSIVEATAGAFELVVGPTPVYLVVQP